MNRKFTKSVVSGADLIPLFSLGELYVSNFLKEGEEPKYPKCKLELGFDPISKVVQLTEQPCQESMFGSQYWYLSGTNEQMVEALKDVALKTISSIKVNSNNRQIYVDCAGNDSTLLSFLDKEKFFRINIDPSDYPNADKNCDLVIKDYFSKEAFYKSGYKKCRYFSANAVFYDVSDPIKFIQDVYDILEDDGVATLQLSYTPLMIKQLEFSNICHEHLTYYNLSSLKYIFDKVGFVIKNVELNNVNAGSIRVYLQKDTNKSNNFLSPADRDICDIRIKSLLEWEEKEGYNSPEIYLEFYKKILELKEKTVNFIKKAKSEGKSVWGLAGSTKGNSLLQFFNLDNTLIDGIAEKQERKWGLRTIGSNIKIYSEEDFRKAAPDYCLILSWAFGESFKIREKEFLKNGTFIFPAPEFYLYSNRNT